MSSQVFDGVRYYIVEGNVKSLAEVKLALKEGGASREFYHSELVTHIISDTQLSSDEAAIPMKDIHNVVHSDWVRMSLKCGAQLPISPFQISSEKLFSNLSVCPSKLIISDVEKLCILLLYYGGKMQRRLDAKVTHLVTMETTGAKYNRALEHPGIKIVTPDWILDCVDAEKILEEEKYHPSLLKTSPAPSTCNGGIHLDTNTTPSSMPGAIAGLNLETDRPEIGVETGNIDHPAVATIVSEIMTDNAHNREALLCSPTAEEQSTTMEVDETVYVEKRKEEGQEMEVVTNQAISLSAQTNYAFPSGPPEKLLDGIMIYFTDYQECIEDDTLEKWKLVVRQHGGQVLDEYDSSRCTHLLALHKKSAIFSQAKEASKCIASAHWLNDVLTDQKMFPPRNPIHFPTAFKWQLPNADQYSVTLTNFIGLERELVKDMLRICGMTYTGHLSRNNTHLICKRPEGKKYEMALEWGVQIVNSMFLSDIIHSGELSITDLSPRYTLLNQPNEFSSEHSSEASRLLDLWRPFLKEYALLHPGLMDDSSYPQGMGVSSLSRKRERPEEEELTGSERTSIDKLPRKIEKASPSVLFTGINLSVVKKLKQIVLRLGGVITDRGRECSHLVTPRVTRTVKFLSGISVCTCVVTPRWVEECGKRRAFVSEEEFALRDTDMEKLFGMEVATSLSRAKEKKLLEGVSVYSTPTVQPSFSDMREIVECAGGELITEEEMKKRFLEGHEYSGDDDCIVSGKRLVVLSTSVDIEAGCCNEFVDRNIGVYNAELILTGVLKQMLNFGKNTFMMNKK